MSTQYTGGKSFVDGIIGAVNSVLPAGMVAETKTKLAQALKSELERMDVATRSELEVQEESLRRARKTIKDLEQRVQQLEDRLKDAD